MNIPPQTLTEIKKNSKIISASIAAASFIGRIEGVAIKGQNLIIY